MPDRCSKRMLSLFAALAIWGAAPARAQLIVKGEDASVRLGIVGQVWANWNQNSSGAQGYQQNFYLRRLRLMASGEVGKDVSFFVETDAPRLGNNPKSLTTGFILQDAMLEWKPRNTIQLATGLFVAPFTHVGLQSVTSYYAVDYGAIAAVPNAPEQTSTLRDIGFQLKGFFFKDHLQYRGGIFDGHRETSGRNSFRGVAYVQYDFFTRQKGYALIGTALGKQKYLSVNAGIDVQGSYRGYSADIAADIPVNGGDEIGGQLQYIFFDGKAKFPTIGRQNDYLVEAAYYIHKSHFQPFFKYETQQFTTDGSKNIQRTGGGANIYIHAQNLKWTAQYQRVTPGQGSTLRTSNDITLQLQFMYF